MGKMEESSSKTKMAAPPPKEEYDIVRQAKNVRNSPAFCRVPGDLPAMGKMKHEVSALRNELKKKSLVELKDLLASTNKIAHNQILLNKLPDRGAKVKQKQEVLVSLVEEREAGEDLATALANLKLPDTTAMEWNIKPTVMNVAEPVTDADKTLKLLSEGIVPGDEQQDSEDLVQSHSTSYLSHKVQVLDTVPRKDRFIPVSSLHNSALAEVKSGLGSPASSSGQSVTGGPSRPVTKVKTEPIPLPKYSNSTTKQLTLQESLSIQQEQAEKLREATVRQAAARLAARSSASKSALKAVATASKETVQTIVDTRWRDTTAPDSDDDEDVAEAKAREEERTAVEKLLDSDDDEEEFHDAVNDEH